jgi:hypothetical protein
MSLNLNNDNEFQENEFEITNLNENPAPLIRKAQTTRQAKNLNYTALENLQLGSPRDDDEMVELCTESLLTKSIFGSDPGISLSDPRKIDIL